MWYLEFLTFILSQTALASITLPWAIILKEYTIEPDCMLSTHFQFKPWGTACGHTWEELKLVHREKYFAFVNVMVSIRILMVIVAVTAQLMMFFIIFYGPRREVLALGGLVTGVLSVVIASDYSNEMDTTMTLPNRYLMGRGPGYLTQLLTAAYGGAIFFFEFYLNYYKKNIDVAGDNACMKFWAFTMSSLAVLSAFGDLVKVGKCPDMVSVFDKNQCPYCDSPLFPMVTVFAMVNVLSTTTLYQMISFLEITEKRWLINSTAALTIAADIAVICGSMLLENADRPGWATFTSGAGILSSLVFLGVYNQLIPCLNDKRR